MTTNPDEADIQNQELLGIRKDILKQQLEEVTKSHVELGILVLPEDDIVTRIMKIIKETPETEHSYFCHGDYHSYTVTDYDTIETKIRELLNAASQQDS
jgi:hypothetical protein